MRVKKFDFIFIAIAVIIIAVLMVNTGGQKPHRVPSDEKHRSLLEEVRKGTKREEVEKVCVSCHNSRIVPLSKNHPPKEQCLICHAGKG